ncbi:MAG: M56 family metallopeptidase [Gammaproteobacteria bacterium]|nr:M56 family metallopeptidase [Gammaproteobacteria bacterium]
MTPEIGLVVASLLILLCAGASIVVVSAVLYPAVAAWLNRMAPATRANFLFAWATVPVWLSSMLLLLVLSPSVAYLLGIGVDHCRAHDHHIHLCVIHTPWVVGGIIEWSVLGGLATLASAWLVAAGARFGKARGKLRMLLTLSTPSTDSPIARVVSSQRHFVFTAGLIRPQIFLSSALLQAVHPRAVAIVVDHEYAHQRRRDGLRLFVAGLFVGLHISSIRHRMLGDLQLAIEQACDEIAASRSGDRLQVAETILHLTRLIGSTAPPVAAVETGFTGADTASRVEGLLRPPIPQRPALFVTVSALAIGFLVLGLKSSDQWHHGAEIVLGRLLG